MKGWFFFPIFSCREAVDTEGSSGSRFVASRKGFRSSIRFFRLTANEEMSQPVRKPTPLPPSPPNKKKVRDGVSGEEEEEARLYRAHNYCCNRVCSRPG